MKGVLDTVSPSMRRIVLALQDANVSGPTRARDVIRAMPKEDKAGFVVARHLDEAMALLDAIGDRRRARRARNEGRVASFYGARSRAPQTAEHVAVTRGRASLARELRLPMRMRLDAVREAAVLSAAKAAMKHGAAGGSSWRVSSGDEPDYTVEVEKDWSRVNSGKDTWASNTDTHRITVSRRWLGVHRRIGDGDGVIDGHILLDASPFIEAEGRVIWEARLARTGRGFSAVVEDRFLSAYGRHVTIHKTLKAALSASPPEGFPRPPSPEDEAALASLAFA